MARKMLLFIALYSTAFGEVLSARLGSYNIDDGQVSVSGVSSGASMATQFHVVHSRDVMGVGLVASTPYMCAEGNLVTTGICMLTPSLVSVTALQAITTSAAWISNIDSTSNMRSDNVWIFAGTQDSVVKSGAGANVRNYYNRYITYGSVKTVFNVAAEHSMPTDNYGGQCDKLNTATYINNCNYNAAFEMLNHIYGGHLNVPVAAINSSLTTFDQGEFFYFAPPVTYSMDTTGYVYVPTGCQDKRTACKLHIAFHGCQMGRYRLGDKYVRHAGYNEVGEANNIIILYPQVIATLTNPQGCWDWWGYTGLLYATKSGFQMTAVYRMMDRIIS